MDKVRIRVPATSANLGSGFDCLGMAFQRYNVFEFEKIPFGIVFKGFKPKYENVHNLTYVAYKAVCDKIGADSSVRITDLETGVPVSRGLGSSATLIVAGAVGANMLHGNILNKEEIFKICTEIEGHPDNVSAAIYGGLCASVNLDNGPLCVKYTVSDKVYFTAVVPDFEVRTKSARATLPDHIGYKDAVFNMSRTAILPNAFANGDFDLIKIAVQDRLHEKYKRRLFKNIDEVEAAAYEVGAVSFIISGAGSTCLCISDKPIHNELNEKIKHLHNNWQAISLTVDNEGARNI